MNNVFEPEVKTERKAFDFPSSFFWSQSHVLGHRCTVTCPNCLVQL